MSVPRRAGEEEAPPTSGPRSRIRSVLGHARRGLAPVSTTVSALALLVVLGVAGTLFGRRAVLLTRLVRLGQPVQRFDDVPKRVRNEAVVVLGQKKLFQRLGPGLIHALIFWGFLVLFPTIVDGADRRPWRRAKRSRWLGDRGGSLFLVDLFVRARRSSASRPRSGSARCSGRSGSRAATCGEADRILGLIALIVTRCCSGTRRRSRSG